MHTFTSVTDPTLSESRSGSPAIIDTETILGSLHRVCLVVTKKVPPDNWADPSWSGFSMASGDGEVGLLFYREPKHCSGPETPGLDKPLRGGITREGDGSLAFTEPLISKCSVCSMMPVRVGLNCNSGIFSQAQTVRFVWSDTQCLLSSAPNGAVTLNGSEFTRADNDDKSVAVC